MDARARFQFDTRDVEWRDFITDGCYYKLLNVDLDAKLASFTQLMIDCPNVESNWTQYHTNLGRKLYKGSEFRGQASEAT